jgi:molybdopterin/thiamine biosynthesis adenylyltransferase
MARVYQRLHGTPMLGVAPKIETGHGKLFEINPHLKANALNFDENAIHSKLQEWAVQNVQDVIDKEAELI